MSSAQSHHSYNGEEEDFSLAFQLATSCIMPGIMKAAVQLDLFGIMAKAGPGAQLSAKQIASQFPTQSPSTHLILDRVLRLLASYSLLSFSLVTCENGETHGLYRLTPACKYFVPNEDGVSLSSLVTLNLDKVYTDSWMHIKDAIIDGGSPFNKAHGMHAFEYTKTDLRFDQVFNKAMHDHSCIIMKKVLDVYKGFHGIKEVVDVAGGHGASLGLITAQYPQIKGINFDLPHVIQQALAFPGVDNVGGDMFESIPKGESIFMKWILHDWDDERCLTILKNCRTALPDDGKVIVVELVVSNELRGIDNATKSVCQMDVDMWISNPGGKERTHEEFEALAKEAGFSRMEKVCFVYNFWVMEFYKT